MNPEQLIAEAGDAIAKWRRHHNTGCWLYIKAGHPKCKKSPYIGAKLGPGLYLTRWRVVNGLTSSQWHSVGTALFNLYIKEKS